MKEKYDGVVKVDGVSSDVMRCIVDYLYSGEMTVEAERAVEFFLAADYLMIESECVAVYEISLVTLYLQTNGSFPTRPATRGGRQDNCPPRNF